MATPRYGTTGVYDGGGAGNALMAMATSGNIVTALAAPCEILVMGEDTTLDLLVVNTTAGQNCMLTDVEDSTIVPLIGTLTMIQEITVGAGESTGTICNSVWGLAVAEDMYKPIVNARVSAGSFVIIGLGATSGGTWYVRYHQHKAQERYW